MLINQFDCLEKIYLFYSMVQYFQKRYLFFNLKNVK